jgi:coronatine-insensitive protein 1
MLNLEESKIDDQGGEWLFHLGDNNPCLESLNITSTDLDELNICEALLSLVQKCPALSSLKMGEIELETLKEIMKYMSMRLEAFGAGCYTLQEEDRLVTAFIPWVTKLKILDLKYTSLSAEGHCQILTYCFCLEELEVSNVLGDKGLEVVGKTSKRLKRLRVDDHEDGSGTITHRGLTAIAEGCQELKFLVMYLSDVTNASLADVGRCLTKLTDFRIVLLQTSPLVKDLPLDAGVQSVLQGCPKLTRFSVYLRIDGLTDRGVSYIGTHGGKLKWVLLGCCGDIGFGLLNLAQGCQKIERLELRDCPIEDAQLANVFLSMRSLKYFWVEGFGATEDVGQYLAATVPYLHVEIMPHRKQLLAYYSLTSPRTDNPPTVQVLTHDFWQGQQ